MVELEVDGKKVQVPEGTMVIQAAQQLNTYIPHFCYHKKLTIAANCRMCLVDVEKMPKAVPACATPVSNGMVVRTRSEKALKAQQAVMEFLLINHPLDCPICDQGGECQLQDLAVGYGKSKSRYEEEKRVVFHKQLGPLISAEEMSRCIHCTRCVRFGQEVAGVMELGMLGRGEHAEITSFLGHSVDSELSGNMIDLCPVGALTSKPFRYSARNWELTRYKSISPHDSVGANLIVQVKQQRVLRVLPLENETINECWISDKDRFSYEGLNSEERLTQAMQKQADTWQALDWQSALSVAVEQLEAIKREHGPDSIAILASPHSTLEELFLLKQLSTQLGITNLDFRLRQTDFRASLQGAPWLGMPIEALASLDSALVIGSFLNRDHPLLAARLRQAAKNGAQLYLLNALDDDALIPTAQRLVAAPSAWLDELGGIIAALARAKEVAVPSAFAHITPTPVAQAAALALNNATSNRAVLLGNAALSHPDFSLLHEAAQWLADNAGATLGFLTEAANTTGAHLIGTTPGRGGLNAAEVFKKPRKAYLLFNVEPEYDLANPAEALAALAQAEQVVSFTAFKPHQDSAHLLDLILPIAPFTETGGSFINAQGTLQSFNGVARPLGETRPGWKILRALGSLLNLPGFAYETVEQVRIDTLKQIGDDFAQRLSNKIDGAKVLLGTAFEASYAQRQVLPSQAFERLADVPIYQADPLVRRAPSLQLTKSAKNARFAALPSSLFDSLGLQDGDIVCVRQGQYSATMPAIRDARLSPKVVRVSAATSASAKLGSLFGEVQVEKAA